MGVPKSESLWLLFAFLAIVVIFWLACIGFLLAPYAYAMSLDDEARKNMRDFYISRGVVECEDSLYLYYSVPNWFITGLKGISYFVTPYKLTYADQLNHIEWKGYGSINAKAARFFYRNEGWTEWFGKKRDDSPPLPDLYAEKKNGKWTVSLTKPPPPGTINPVKPLKCEEIKRLVK